MAKSKFTTTLDTELLKQAKIEAIQLDMSVAEFLEKLIKEYFEGKDRNNPYPPSQVLRKIIQSDRGGGLPPANLLANGNQFCQ